ncbi:MAG: universal stress protein [Balneolales bacterium]
MKNPNILVTTDFSELGNKAFEAAAVMVSTLGGKATPFHVFITDEEAYRPKLRQLVDNKKQFQAKLDSTARQYINDDHLAPGKIVNGDPVPMILKAAQDYDIIVMSSHGRTGFNRLYLGSVAEKVLRFAKVPVVIIEEKSHFQALNKILVTTDFSVESEAAFSWAGELARGSGAEMDVVHVVSIESSSILNFENPEQINRVTDETTDKLQNLINKHYPDIKDRVHPKIIVSKQSAHKKLAELAESSDYNLIVMATVGHTGLNYLVLGSTAASLVRRVETAVLVVHPKK